MALGIRVDARELVRLAGDLGKVQIDEAARKVVAEDGLALKTDMAQRAPVLTGALSGSIQLTVSGLSARVDAKIRYGGFQEFGTSKMAPQPYALPAYQAAFGPFVQHLEEAARKAMLP